MAWNIRGTPNWGTNTATTPTHSAGNMIIAASFRDGSTTPPSLPGGVNLTNIFSTTGANTCSIRVAFKIATSSSETIGTFTNGTRTVCCVLENAAPGAFVRGQASNTTFNFPALTPLEADGTSGFLAFIFSRDGSSPASVGTAPSGMTNWGGAQGNATDCGGVHYDLTGTSWTSQNVATGVAATGWQSFVLEILDQELPTTNFFGYSTIGGTEAGPNVDTTQAGSRFIVPEDCIIDEVWVYAKHFDNVGIGKTCIYSTDAGGSPIVPDVVLDNGSSFDFNQFWAWRKSTGYTYSAVQNEEIYPSAAFNDTWHMRYDGGGTTDQTYDKQNFAYASTFEDPSTSTDRSVADIQLSIIIKYTPAAGAIAGTSSGAATVAGVISAKGTLQATSTGVATTSGTLRGKVNISASTSGQATVSGQLSGEGVLIASTSGSATLSGVISAKGSLLGQSIGAATASGSLQAEGILQGTTTGAATTSGTLQGKGLISGSTQGSSTVTGILLSEGLMLGSTSGSSTVSGSIIGRVSISGSIQGLSNASATIDGIGRISSTISGVANVSGTIVAKGLLLGVVTGTSTATGNLTTAAGASNISGSAFGIATVTGAIRNQLSKPAHTVNFTFVKQSHVVNFTSVKHQHSINYTFVKRSHTIDTE